MKKLIILISLGIFCSAHATNSRQLDTIYANEKMTMALFFPTDIKQAITGSENFVFTYNREKEQNLGLLKAVKGASSNLLVITTDGRVYSYILKYVGYIDNPNRFITVKESIGHAKNRLNKENSKYQYLNAGIKATEVTKRLHGMCESLLKLQEEKHIRKKEGDIILSLTQVKYHEEYVFLQFEIENKSRIRFDFDYLKIAKVNGNQKRNASFQELPLQPVYIYNKPKYIVPNARIKMVYVVPKFTIDKNQKIGVRLQEMNTTRKIDLIWK